MFKIGMCLSLITSLVGCAGSAFHFEGLTLSPDGTYILAVYPRSGSTFIYKIPLDTGIAARLTNTRQGFEGVPSISPDGKRVAYSYGPPGQEAHSHVVIANVDGSGSHAWMTSEANDFRPVFANNKTIIFARSRYYGSYSPIARPAQHEWNFYASDLDGTSIRQLTDEEFYRVSRVSVSPDGKSMMFVSAESTGDIIAIYSLEQPPKSRRILKPHLNNQPESGGVLADAVFLPDGKKILFLAASNVSSEAFDYDVYKMDLQTQDIEKLTIRNGYAYALEPSRDGRKAVFARDDGSGRVSEIWFLDLSNRNLTPLRITGLD